MFNVYTHVKLMLCSSVQQNIDCVRFKCSDGGKERQTYCVVQRFGYKKGCISKVNVFYSSCYSSVNLKALLNEEKVSSYIRQKTSVLSNFIYSNIPVGKVSKQKFNFLSKL